MLGMDGRHLDQHLTGRQEQILRMVARGHTNTEIAEELGISLNGVKWHIRELFAKYGVDTREELAEAWQDTRRPVNRVRGWARGLAFGLPLKLTAGGTAAAAVLGVAAGTVVAVLNSDSPPAAEAKKQTKETATPQPTATPTPSIVAPTVTLMLPMATPIAVQISDEDYRLVLDEMRQVLSKSGLGQASTRGVYTIHDLELETAEYLHNLTGPFELGDGDHYIPAADDGGLRDLLQFRWRIPDVPVLLRPGVADFELTAVIEDGKPGRVWWHYSFDRRQDATFNSRILEQLIAQGPSDLAIGQPVHLAFRDNAGSAEWTLNGALREDGGLCLIQIFGDVQVKHCGIGETPETMKVLNLGARYAPDGTATDRSVAVITAPEITSIQVVSDAFEPRTFETQPIPGELPFEGRVAYITLLPSPRSFVVIGHNAAGEEVAREHSWP